MAIRSSRRYRPETLYGLPGISREWTGEAGRLLSIYESGGRAEARHATLRGRFPEIGQRLNEVLSEWIAHNDRLAKQASDEAVAAIRDSERRSVTAIIIALLLSGVLGYLTVRSIVHPNSEACRHLSRR